MEACRRLGIELKELVRQSKSKVRESMGGAPPEEIVDMRWQHLEHKRSRKLEMLLHERQQVLKEEQQGSLAFLNGHPSYYGSTHGLATGPGEAYMVNFAEADSPDRPLNRSLRTEQSLYRSGRSSRVKQARAKSVLTGDASELERMKRRQQTEIQ